MLKNKSSPHLPLSLFLVLLFLLFFALRLFHLPESINFGSDAGRDFLAVRDIVVNKHLVLVGPPSQYTVEGKQFFFGPASYYVILPALVIGNWEPLAVSYYLIILNAAVLLIALVILNKYIKKKLILYLFALFCAITPAAVAYAQSYWNPHLMLPVSILLIALLVKSKNTKGKTIWLSAIIGFLFGLGLQFHYSFILAIVLSIIWLLITKKLQPLSIVCLIGGFILGFLPLIIFDLRNHFYNSTIFLQVFGSSSESRGDFNLNSFYFISLLPFLFLLGAWMLAKLAQVNKYATYLLITVYILGSLFMLISPPQYALTYPMVQKLSQTIQKDQPKQFNIVDQVTGDNRAMSLRYLLTIHGDAPDDVLNYPESQTIYIYSKESLDTLLKDPVWEIKSFLPFSSSKTQKLENDIMLYNLLK